MKNITVSVYLRKASVMIFSRGYNLNDFCLTAKLKFKNFEGNEEDALYESAEITQGENWYENFPSVELIDVPSLRSLSVGDVFECHEKFYMLVYSGLERVNLIL